MSRSFITALAAAFWLVACGAPRAQTIPFLLSPQVPFAMGAALAASAPVNSTLPLISGTPQVGQPLTASNGTWLNTPTGFTYQWLSGGTTPISGATATTYVPVTLDIGATLSILVTASNGVGSTPATSAGVAPVIPANLQVAISTLANGSAGDAFGSNPTFIPPVAAAYEVAVSVLTADELFGDL